LQELKNFNEKLIKYFDHDKLKILIDYITVMPTGSEGHDRGHKYPFIAGEIFNCEINQILDKFFEPPVKTPIEPEPTEEDTDKKDGAKDDEAKDEKVPTDDSNEDSQGKGVEDDEGPSWMKQLEKEHSESKKTQDKDDDEE